MKFRGFFGGVLVGLILGGVGGLAVIKILRRSRPANVKPSLAVTVNDQEISMETLQGQALLASGPAVLRSLIEQKLIEQEAARQKLTLTPAETQELEKVAETIKDRAYRQAALEKGRMTLLARHLLLNGVSEAQIREVYDLYKPELTQYELHAIVVLTYKDGRYILDKLQEGIGFDILAKNYSQDPSRSNGGRVGFLSLPQMRRTLGQQAVDEMRRLKPDQASKIIYTPFGLTILKLGKVKSDYQDLKPFAEAMLAESRRTEVTYNLFQKAKINSPFMETKPGSLSSPNERGIKSEGDSGGGLQLPRPTGSDPTNELPSVQNTPSTAPAGLPSFKSATPLPAALPKPRR